MLEDTLLIDNYGMMMLNTIFNVDDYIKQHNHICYCECFILSDGRIVEARPSHQITHYSIAKSLSESIDSMDDFNIFLFEEEMFSISLAVEVRYELQRYGFDMTSKQLESFNKMVKAGLILDERRQVQSMNLVLDEIRNGKIENRVNKEAVHYV